MTDNSDLVEKMADSSKALGADNLLQLLKNYSRVEGSKQKKQVIIGVVGFPNVGKSSLINTLKKGRAAQVGDQPGVTKGMQHIHLDKQMMLIDSPGVVLNKN